MIAEAPTVQMQPTTLVPPAGVLAGVVSAICSGGMVFAVHRCAGLIPSSEITLIRAVSAVVVLLPFVSAKRAHFASRASAILWLRSLIGAVSILCLAWNLQHTTVGFAYTLFNLAPFLVVLFGAWLGHEALSRSKVLSIALIVSASVIFWYVSRFEAGPRVWIVGLIGMCAAAFAYALVKSIPKAFRAIDLTWTLSLATIPVALAVKSGPWIVPTGHAGLLVFLVCVLSLASNLLANISFRILPLSMATALVPSAIIWGVLLDLTDHDFPHLQGLLGCLLYLAAVIRMGFLARKEFRRSIP